MKNKLKLIRIGFLGRQEITLNRDSAALKWSWELSTINALHVSWLTSGEKNSYTSHNGDNNWSPSFLLLFRACYSFAVRSVFLEEKGPNHRRAELWYGVTLFTMWESHTSLVIWVNVNISMENEEFSCDHQYNSFLQIFTLLHSKHCCNSQKHQENWETCCA